MLTAPTLAELAAATGRPAESYTAYATTTLLQATLLFAAHTRLTDWPADPQLAQLARMAVLELADRLYLEQPYQAAKASPYQSESIGSYSYSKGSSSSSAAAGRTASSLPAGLLWWDLALDGLSADAASGIASGSIDVADDDLVRNDQGTLSIAGPADSIDPPYVTISAN